MVEGGSQFTAVQHQRVRTLLAQQITGAPEPIQDNKPSLTGPRMRNTMLFNFTGLPTVSTRCGFSEDELPIGLQIERSTKRPCCESLMLTSARRTDSQAPISSKARFTSIALASPDRMRASERRAGWPKPLALRCLPLGGEGSRMCATGLLSDRNIGYILIAAAAPSRARRTPLRVDA
jgi:hypothetical protein